MKEHILLFLTHYDHYLDIILNLDTDSRFNDIRQRGETLRKQRSQLSIEEANSIESTIFYDFLMMVAV
jgi:hypothetical protein